MQEEKETKKTEISVVVPIFNEEDNVEKLHTKIKEECAKLGRTFEIIFINDGSTDRTAEKCRNLSPLRLINFRKNYGQTAAFDAGFQAARGEVL